MQSTRLDLIVTTTLTGSVGYGYVYKCEVLEVRSGEFSEEQFILTVLVGDRKVEQFLSSNLAPRELVLSFERNKENEPYSLMPITGMVDGEKTSWNLVEYHLGE